MPSPNDYSHPKNILVPRHSVSTPLVVRCVLYQLIVLRSLSPHCVYDRLRPECLWRPLSANLTVIVLHTYKSAQIIEGYSRLIQRMMAPETVVTVDHNKPAAAPPPQGGALDWIKINVDYFKTPPGLLKIIQLVSN